MRIVKDICLSDFEFWSGAKDHAALFSASELDQLDQILPDVFCDDDVTETQINDLFWSEPQFCADLIGAYKFDLFSSSSSIKDSLESVIPFIYETAEADDLDYLDGYELKDKFFEFNTDVDSGEYPHVFADFESRVQNFFTDVLEYFRSDEIKERSDYYGYSKAEILKDLILDDFDIIADYLE
jgi:hypothetical protein